MATDMKNKEEEPKAKPNAPVRSLSTTLAAAATAATATSKVRKPSNGGLWFLTIIGIAMLAGWSSSLTISSLNVQGMYTYYQNTASSLSLSSGHYMKMGLGQLSSYQADDEDSYDDEDSDDDEAEDTDTTGNAAIPHRLIFTYKNKLLKVKDPKLSYENVLNTIRIYHEHWNMPFSETNIPKSVWFLNNKECLRLLQKVYPKLVEYFLAEPKGSYKGDLCRLAAMYQKGGYYSDIDMKAIRPLNLTPEIQFASAFMPHKLGFFQSFTASAPQHPIVKENFEVLLEYYHGRKTLIERGMEFVKFIQEEENNNKESAKQRFQTELESLDQHFKDMSMRNNQGQIIVHLKNDFAKENTTDFAWEKAKQLFTLAETKYNHAFLGNELYLGPRTMMISYDRVLAAAAQAAAAAGLPEPTKLDNVFFLEELNLQDQPNLYPHFPRQTIATGCCCNYVVHDPADLPKAVNDSSVTPYFFSRYEGASSFCHFRHRLRRLNRRQHRRLEHESLQANTTTTATKITTIIHVIIIIRTILWHN